MPEQLSQSPDETRAVAAQLVKEWAAPGAVWALYGDLGAGKTCFVQGVAAALQVKQAVSSPTYTLVHEYTGYLPVYHVDLYRIHHPDEAWDIGLAEYMDGNGITLVEWAERVAELMPERTRHIELRYGATAEERIIRWGLPDQGTP